ncbi:MAG: hypothetical protein K2H13_05695 [Eubacterium sp.]|nr:hypothetical protein [Eubacterium sp.]
MRVWLYARLSRDEDDELNSLTNQQNIIREYADKNRDKIAYKKYSYYKKTDNGFELLKDWNRVLSFCLKYVYFKIKKTWNS